MREREKKPNALTLKLSFIVVVYSFLSQSLPWLAKKRMKTNNYNAKNAIFSNAKEECKCIKKVEELLFFLHTCDVETKNIPGHLLRR